MPNFVYKGRYSNGKIAEGIIDFGIIGLMTYPIILAIIVSKADKLGPSLEERSSTFSIFYYFAFGLLFYVLRGDLLSSYAFSIGFIVPIYGLLFINKLFFKYVDVVE